MTKYTATMTSEDTFVLPRAVLDHLHLRDADEVQFVPDEKGVHLRCAEANRFWRWLEAAPSGESTQEFIRTTQHTGISDEELERLCCLNCNASKLRR